MSDLIPEGKTRLILVEGKDDIEFFKRLVSHLQSTGTPLPNYSNCEILGFGGKDKLANFLFQLINDPAFDKVTHIGIVRDFDFDTDAFSSIRSALRTANREAGKNALPIPQAILLPTSEQPCVAALTIPLEREGALETMLLEVISGDSLMNCVDEFFSCIETNPNASVAKRRLDKQRLHVFISGKKVDESQSTPDDVKRNLLRNIYSMTWLPEDFWENDGFNEAKTFLRQLVAD